MAQISKRRLSDRTWEQVWNGLVAVVRASKDRKTVDSLLDGLLTKTEKVVLAKRLMIGILTICGMSGQEIAEVLNMSFSTVFAYRAQLQVDQSYMKTLKACLPGDVEGWARARKATMRKTEKEPNFLVELLGDILAGRSDRSRLIRSKYPDG